MIAKDLKELIKDLPDDQDISLNQIKKYIITKNCLICNKPFVSYNKGKFCSLSCFCKTRKGESHPCFSPKLSSIHRQSAYNTFRYNNPPNKCENINCNKKSSIYCWSIIDDLSESRSHDNFMQLCISCRNKKGRGIEPKLERSNDKI